MDPFAALLAGLLAGLAIAMQFGAVSVLLVEASIVAGPRAGVAAGLAVATADLGFAAVAAAAGGTAGAALASRETEIHVIAAVTLAAIALHGLAHVARERGGRAGGAAGPMAAAAPGIAADATVPAASPRAHYARFLAMTAVNPLTIASFAAVAAALSLDGPAAAVAFVAGVGAASAAWHGALTLAAGHAGRWITPAISRGLAIGGRLVVLAIAVHLIMR